MFVLFDAVWDPFPQLGKQRAPKPGLHNSGWVQSPGAKILVDPRKHDTLKDYVAGVLGRFKDDRRDPRLGPVQRAGQHQRIELRPARAGVQARAGHGAAGEDVRLGPRGRPRRSR